MKFTKMQGAGNDFILIDLRVESAADWGALSVGMCDRHFGIGADGLILVDGGSERGYAMTMYNPDGSDGQMCGNGIRCFARFLQERGEIHGEKVEVQTGAGQRWIQVVDAADDSYRVKVGMGAPEFDPREIPVTLPGDRVIDHTLTVDGVDLAITAVSMGNPHAVAFVDDMDSFDLARIGPMVEHHPAFPERVNFEICEVLEPTRLRMRVWERGAGITLACGSGAAAVAAAAVITGRVEPGSMDLLVTGGVLQMTWNGEGHEVMLTGPAENVFDGQWTRAAVANAAR